MVDVLNLKRHMLTTTDNPFNPFTHYAEWYEFDEAAGHHTCAYLARVTRSSDELSDADKDLAIEYAIDEIVKENPLQIYIKVAEKK